MNTFWHNTWKRARWSPRPATRLAMGLVSLTIGLLMLVEFFVGFPPDRLTLAQRERTQISVEIAWQVARAIDGQGGEQTALSTALREAMNTRAPDLRSLQLRSHGGEVLAEAGPHARYWTLANGSAPTLDNLKVPLRSGGQPAGEVQLAFASAWPHSLAGWLRDPALQRLLMLALLGVLVFWLYLRRMLRHLDPNAAVPERVREAFNTLTEGVLVVDASGHVVLANQAFCAINGDDADQLTGRLARQIDWLGRALGDRPLPWAQAMGQRERVSGLALSVRSSTGPRELVLNCAPILDGRRLRGCLLSFADVTALHERTERLREAMAALQRSRDEVGQQRTHTERDPLAAPKP